MRKTLIKALFLGVVMAVSGVTYAGFQATKPVELFTEPSTGLPAARGTLRDTHNSPDSVAYIGCTRYVFNSGTNQALCSATDAAGHSLFCYVADPTMLEVIEMLNAASFLSFAVNVDGFSCDHVTVSVSSANL